MIEERDCDSKNFDAESTWASDPINCTREQGQAYRWLEVKRCKMINTDFNSFRFSDFNSIDLRSKTFFSQHNLIVVMFSF